MGDVDWVMWDVCAYILNVSEWYTKLVFRLKYDHHNID